MRLYYGVIFMELISRKQTSKHDVRSNKGRGQNIGLKATVLI